MPLIAPISTPPVAVTMSMISSSVFITPLPREQLFDPGSVFAPHELTRRVLSMFWRDCCCPPHFSRAPAPVMEMDGTLFPSDDAPRPLQAWWIMDDGLVSESEGPESSRLRPYFGDIPMGERLWPRYEFRVLASPFDVEMMFHRSALASQGHRTRLFVQPDGRVRVLTRTPWWVG